MIVSLRSFLVGDDCAVRLCGGRAGLEVFAKGEAAGVIGKYTSSTLAPNMSTSLRAPTHHWCSCSWAYMGVAAFHYYHAASIVVGEYCHHNLASSPLSFPCRTVFLLRNH